MSQQRRYNVQKRETFTVAGRRHGFMEEMPFEWGQERWIDRKIKRKGNHWCGVTLLKDVQSCHLLFQKTEKKESKLPILRNNSLSFHRVLLHRDFFPVKRRTWISRVSTLSPQIITPRAGRGHAESGPFYHLSRVKAVLLPTWGRADRGEENT